MDDFGCFVVISGGSWGMGWGWGRFDLEILAKHDTVEYIDLLGFFFKQKWYVKINVCVHTIGINIANLPLHRLLHGNTKKIQTAIEC